MPNPHCQDCRSSLKYFSPVCPYYQGPILAASAIDVLGASVAEGLRLNLDSEPKLARKKTDLYLKLCRSFICDSELGLLSVRDRLERTRLSQPSGHRRRAGLPPRASTQLKVNF